MRKFFLFLIIIIFCSFSDTSLKKRISDAFFRYEFYTTNKDVSPKPERDYYWFKGGAVHNSEYGVGGELLHEEYLKFYHSNQLAEAGKFKNGLKVGYWKTWHPNGVLQSKVYWDQGQMDGSYLLYNENGELAEKGSYKNNKRHGRWMSFVKNDTLRYRNGVPVIKKLKKKKAKDTISVKEDKPGLLKRMFSKKKKKANTNANAPVQQSNVKAANTASDQPGFFKRVFTSKKDKPTDEIYRQNAPVQTTPEKKDGFFKRLFSKKDKKPISNGQG